jgi:hypothetical protein
MRPWVRPASLAFLAATITALVVDAVLQGLIGVANVASPDSGTPWWVTAHLVERGRWVALAVILCVATRGIDDRPSSGKDAWRTTGMAVMATPLLWVLANWIVTVILFTLAGRWDIDGRGFLEPGYYRALLVAYVPWLLGGAAVAAASSHVD